MKIGMNLTGLIYWVDDLPTIDRMKAAGAWGGGKVLSADANGWPTAIEGTVYCMVPMTDEATEYTIRWEGAGTPGRDWKLSKNFKPTFVGDHILRVVTMAAPDEAGYGKTANQLMVMKIDPADPIRNVSVVETKHDAAWLAGEVFDPDLVDRLKGCEALRFMDWLDTNHSTAKELADFSKLSSYSWVDRAPIEACVMMAAACGARAWLNVPMGASDDLIRALGRLTRPGDIIEPSNEVWNTGFRQATDVVTAAKRFAHIASILAPMNRKLSIGWQTVEHSRGWDAFVAAYRAAGGPDANAICSAYLGNGLQTIATLTAAYNSLGVEGVHAKLLDEIETATRNRLRAAKAASAQLGGDLYVYEGNPFHLRTSNGLDTAVPLVIEIQQDDGAYRVGKRLLEVCDEEGVALFMFFNWSSPPTNDGYYGIVHQPTLQVFDEWRCKAPALTIEQKVDALWEKVFGRLGGGGGI